MNRDNWLEEMLNKEYWVGFTVGAAVGTLVTFALLLLVGIYLP